MRHNDYKQEVMKKLQDPNFRKDYAFMDPEFQIICTMLEHRERLHMTQVQLAEAAGVTQADISRIEKGTANPSLHTLEKLAQGMGMRLKIEFVEK